MAKSGPKKAVGSSRSAEGVACHVVPKQGSDSGGEQGVQGAEEDENAALSMAHVPEVTGLLSHVLSYPERRSFMK